MITVRNASNVDDPVVVEVEVFYVSLLVACHGVKAVPPHLGGSIFRNSKTKRMTKRRRRSVDQVVVVDEDVVQAVPVEVVLVAVVDHHLEDLEGTKRGTYPRHNVR